MENRASDQHDLTYTGALQDRAARLNVDLRVMEARLQQLYARVQRQEVLATCIDLYLDLPRRVAATDSIQAALAKRAKESRAGLARSRTLIDQTQQALRPGGRHA